MKDTITVNRVPIFIAGLHSKTDFIDWALMDYIYDRGFRLNLTQSVYIPINYSDIIRNMPMLGITTKDPLTHRFKRLRNLGLIISHKSIDNHIFIRLTDLAISILKGDHHG